MGTSKSYIAPTKLEWSNAKRAVSAYLRNMDSKSRTKVVAKYAEAMHKSIANKTRDASFGTSFSSAAGNVIIFAKAVADNGLNDTLVQFGRNDLIGMPPETIIRELLDQFTNHSSTIEDSLALDALSSAFDKLGIESPDNLADMDLDMFLLELIISFVNINFDFRFYEKISRMNLAEDTHRILLNIHGYIEGVLRAKLTTPADISKINLSKMYADKIISDMLDDAFSTCMTVYGDEE